MEKIKALAIDVENSGCSYHRVKLPFLYGGKYLHEYSSDLLEDRLKECEIVVFNRNYPVGGLEQLKKEKAKYGFKVCLDLDDYWQLYPGHFLYEYYKLNNIGRLIKDNIKFADVITVTTERLAEKVRQMHGNVHVIPNALPYGHGQFKKPTGVVMKKNFNFIYAGQKSHLQDIQTISKALTDVSFNRPEAGFILAGFQDAPDGVWRNIEKAFTSNGKLKNYQRVNNLPLDAYMNVLRPADAMIVPLEDNEFNSCKSNLKILEAGAYAMPVICSNVAPYNDCKDAPVFFAETRKDWVYFMESLLSDPYNAIRKGRDLQDWCRQNHDLAPWNEKRFQILKNTIHENN